MRKRSGALRQTAIVFAAQIVVNVFNYGFNIIVSRRLTVAEYGEVWTVVTCILLASAPAIVILNVGSRFATEFYAAGDEERLRGFTGWFARFTAILGAGVFAVLGYSARRLRVT